MEHDDFPNRYVTGFAIDPADQTVLLLLKDHGPAVVKNKMTGVGGHIKIGESPVGAMRREALEEVGLDLPESGQWQQFHFQRHPCGKQLFYFAAYVPHLRLQVKRRTSEIPVIAHCDYLPHQGLAYNICWLVPMARTWLQYPEHHYLEG